MSSQIASTADRTQTSARRHHGETDWNRVWSQFTEGMRQMTESIRQMEQTYQNTYVWDRPIAR